MPKFRNTPIWHRLHQAIADTEILAFSAEASHLGASGGYGVSLGAIQYCSDQPGSEGR